MKCGECVPTVVLLGACQAAELQLLFWGDAATELSYSCCKSSALSYVVLPMEINPVRQSVQGLFHLVTQYSLNKQYCWLSYYTSDMTDER